MKELVPLVRASVSPAAVAKKRRRIALAVAGASDLLQLAFIPLFVEGATSPFDVALDVATAAALLFILGFRWRLMVALAVELVPGVDLFPSWTAMVLSLPTLPPDTAPPLPPSPP